MDLHLVIHNYLLYHNMITTPLNEQAASPVTHHPITLNPWGHLLTNELRKFVNPNDPAPFKVQAIWAQIHEDSTIADNSKLEDGH